MFSCTALALFMHGLITIAQSISRRSAVWLLTCQDFSVIENLPGGTSLHLGSARDDDNIQLARYTDTIGEE